MTTSRGMRFHREPSTFFGKQLRAVRKESKLSLLRMAARCGVSAYSWAEYEQRGVLPRYDSIEKIAAGTGKPVGYFFP